MGEKGHIFGIVAQLALEMALSDSKLCSDSECDCFGRKKHAVEFYLLNFDFEDIL